MKRFFQTTHFARDLKKVRKRGKDLDKHAVSFGSLPQASNLILAIEITNLSVRGNLHEIAISSRTGF